MDHHARLRPGGRPRARGTPDGLSALGAKRRRRARPRVYCREQGWTTHDPHGRLCASGASHGAVVWAAYAVVEQALDAAAPLLKGGTSALAPSHLGVIAVVISSFLFLGFVWGAASGLFLKILDARGASPQSPDSAARFRRVAVLTLALASVAGLMLTRPFGKAEALSLAASAALVVGLAVCERAPAGPTDWGSWATRGSRAV